jgi:hypothetical protein
MALLPTNINYSGVDVNLLIQEAFADTLFHTKFGTRLVESVKSEYFFFDLSNTGELTAQDCCPSTFADVTLNQRSGSVCAFQFALSACYKDIIGTARELKMRKGNNAENILQDIDLIAGITENSISTVSTQWDNVILNGNTAGATGTYLDLCDGLLTKFKADSTVIDVTAVPGNLTVSGVIGEIDKVINAIPNSLIFNPKKVIKLGVSTKIARLYAQALANTQNLFIDITKTQVLSYMGYELVPLAFMPANQMFATYSDNFIQVYDSETDLTTLNIYDKGAYSSCKEVEFVLNFRGAIDYGFGSEIVYYWN